MLENVTPLLLAVLSLALLLIGPRMRPNRQFQALVSQGDAGQGPIATPPPASQEGWRNAIEHLQSRLGQVTASNALLEQDVARLEREKADLEAKYLARVKSAEEKKQKIEAWRRKRWTRGRG